MSGLFETLTGVRAASWRLPGRGALRMTGSDRVRFLNGMVSNDVAALEPGQSCRAALLDRKGRILSDLHVLAVSDAFVLDIAPDTLGVVRETLEKHVIADDVTIEDLGEGWAQLALEGPGVPEALRAAGLPTPHSGAVVEGRSEAEGGLWLARGTLTPEGVKGIGPAGTLAAALEKLGLPELSEPVAEALRILALQPAYGIDMTARNFPAEARLEDAVSFTKGCFLGQEIVARIDSRGHVNRFLVRLRADAPVTRGDAVSAAGAVVGEITSAISLPAIGHLALGYVRAAHAEHGSELDVAGVRAVIDSESPAQRRR